MNYSKLNRNKEKIKNYLQRNFPIILEQGFKCPTFIIGGAVKDILNDKKPKDLDIVVLHDLDCIELFTKYHKLEFIKNSFGGYKINYNNLTIDMWNTNDLYNVLEYTYDGLFYDINNDYIIPVGYIWSMNEMSARELNADLRHPNKDRREERRRKIKEGLGILKSS
jgi:hypothetical protein